MNAERGHCLPRRSGRKTHRRGEKEFLFLKSSRGWMEGVGVDE